MARYLAPHRRNPDIFGSDVEDLAVMAVGLAATAVVNDQLIAPTARGFIPQSNQTVAKLGDAVTTGVTAWGIGEVVDMTGERKLAKDLKTGGLILAVARAISSVVPGFQISAQVPKKVSALLPNAPAGNLPAGASAAPAVIGAATAAPMALLPAGGRYPPMPGYGSLSAPLSAGL